jgi:L-methionine (R)-S-oxide reductase
MGIEETLPSPILAALLEDADAVLRACIAHFGCAAGTVHWLAADGALALGAHANLPPPIVEVIQTVPIGKGIAGLAAKNLEPVCFCNLQTDDTGRARPAARTTGMEGSIAVPMLVNGELRGVLGIAKIDAHEWNDAEKALLLHIGSKLGELRPKAFSP